MNWLFTRCLPWAIWFGFFLGYELWAGLDHNSRTPMLTQAVTRYVPWYYTMIGLSWLWLHFAVRYANPAYVQHLKTGK